MTTVNRTQVRAGFSGELGRPSGGVPRTPSWLSPQGLAARLREELKPFDRRSSAPPPPENPYAELGRVPRSSSLPPPMVPPPTTTEEPEAVESAAPEPDTYTPREDHPNASMLPPSLDTDPREEQLLALHDALDALQRDRDALASRALEAEGRFAQFRRDVLAESEGQLLRLAVAVAERVVARELRTDPALVARWAAEALGALVAVSADVRPSIAVGVATASLVPEDVWAALLGDLRVERDSALPPLGAEVRAGMSAVDFSPQGRLAAVRAELLGDAEGAAP